MEDSTSIMDLPNKMDGISKMPDIDYMVSNVNSGSNENNTNVDAKYMNKIINGIQSSGSSTLGSLPSRDIPMNSIDLQLDERIRANYVPPSDKSHDFVNEYESSRPSRMKDKNTVKQDKQMAIDDLYVPFIVALLYFIFNMPVIMLFSYRYLKFFHTSDGNMNGIGLFIKSIIFGIFVYIIQRGISLL